jgi:uncharacterized protein (DUF1499 family)
VIYFIKIIVAIFFLVVALLIGRLVFLSLTSKAPTVELVNEKLRPCPSTPNCVSSEEAGNAKYDAKNIEPFKFNSTAELAWSKLRAVIKSTGGEIRYYNQTYLWATYSTKIFRFVDDMEFRMVAEENIIHVRSGSRVGHSDLGVNSKNVENVRQLFNQSPAVN